MAKKKKTSVRKVNNAKISATQMVIDVMKRRQAFDEESAIDVQQFKNVKLSSDIIGYTMGNLISEGVVHATEDKRYYYDAKNYHKLEKKVTKGFTVLIAVPVILLCVFVLLKYVFKM